MSSVEETLFYFLKDQLIRISFLMRVRHNLRIARDCSSIFGRPSSEGYPDHPEVFEG